MNQESDLLTTNRKALTLNLDEAKYGTFAEIGAGQEVSRLFFQAGDAAGTIAKSMSAYDMTFSDEINGKAPRYVSRERLVTMLDHEFALLHERLFRSTWRQNNVFCFRRYCRRRKLPRKQRVPRLDGRHFPTRTKCRPLHAHHTCSNVEKDHVLQQDALGIVGVNLIYGAFNYL